MSEEQDKQLEANLAKAGFERSEFEPKTIKRFIVKMTGQNGETIVPSYVICSVSRPSFLRETVEYPTPHFWEDSAEPVTSKYSWLPLTMEVYDPISPSSSQRLIPFMDKHEKFNLTINILGPVGDVVEEWEILGCEILGADLGVLNWADDGEPLKIKLTIKFDYAVFQF